MKIKSHFTSYRIRNSNSKEIEVDRWSKVAATHQRQRAAEQDAATVRRPQVSGS